MYADAYEYLPCPKCGAVLRECRPVALGPQHFTCKQCGASLRFSTRGQRRLIYVVYVALGFGPLAGFAGFALGEAAMLIVAFAGAISALGMLVWQGQVPQLEITDDT